MAIRKKLLSCAVIIVTHNSQLVYATCLRSLMTQTLSPKQIIVVDSGSNDTSYLHETHCFPLIIHEEKLNVGFCVGNNIGLNYVDPTIRYVLFLNPDAFLTPSFLEKATAHMEHPLANSIGALSGLLLGYEMEKNQPTGRIDSTGIFPSWFGRWVDRGQGERCIPFPVEYSRAQFVPALCGALMFCRRDALKSVELGPNQVMDPSFYMYKEDIDLSLRLRQKGWSLIYVPDLMAYHCRGWNRNRGKVSYEFRLLSAKNEVTMHKRMKSPFYFFSLLKYFLVKTFNI